MRCAGCDAENPSEYRFYEQCGATLEIRCPHCDAASRPGARFCGVCGQRLETGRPAAAPAAATSPAGAAVTSAGRRAPYTPKHLVQKVLAGRSALEGERRQVTVLFADLAGFTTLAERLAPEEAHRIMDRCFDVRGVPTRRGRRLGQPRRLLRSLRAVVQMLGPDRAGTVHRGARRDPARPPAIPQTQQRLDGGTAHQYPRLAPPGGRRLPPRARAGRGVGRNRPEREDPQRRDQRAHPKESDI